MRKVTFEKQYCHQMHSKINVLVKFTLLSQAKDLTAWCGVTIAVVNGSSLLSVAAGLVLYYADPAQLVMTAG